MSDKLQIRQDYLDNCSSLPTLSRWNYNLVKYIGNFLQSAKCQALALTTGSALLVSSYFVPTTVTAYVADPFVSALVETTGVLSSISSEVVLEKAVQNYRVEALSYMLKDGIGKSSEALQAHLTDIAVRKEIYGTAAQRAYAAGDIKSARRYAMKDLLWREQNLWDTRNPAVLDVFNPDELMTIFKERLSKAATEGNELLAQRYLNQIEKLKWSI